MGETVIQTVSFPEAIFIIIMIMIMYALVSYMLYNIVPRKLKRPLLFLLISGAVATLSFSSQTFVVYNPAINSTTVTLYNPYGNSYISYPLAFTNISLAFILVSLGLAFLTFMIFLYNYLKSRF